LFGWNKLAFTNGWPYVTSWAYSSCW
jgi:hypothetical protein